MDPVTAGIMGIGGGFISMMGAREQNAIQRDMARAQYNIRMSNYRWGEMGNSIQHMYRNLNISRQNQARFRQNREIARAANSTRAMKEKALQENVGSQLINISRAQQQSTAKLSTAASGAGLTPASGTVQALKRQLAEGGRDAVRSLALNNHLGKQNIIREQEAALARRDLYGYTNEAYYMPAQPPQYIDPPGMSTMGQLSAFMGGAASGMSIASSYTTATA